LPGGVKSEALHEPDLAQQIVEAAVAAQRIPQRLNGVRIVIHEDGRVMSAAPFSKALTGYVSTALYAKWAAKKFGESGIDARITTPAGGADAFGQKWAYDVTLTVPAAEIIK